MGFPVRRLTRAPQCAVGQSYAARRSSGDTALILAALCGHVDAVDLLLRAGASKLATGASGLTALQCAQTSQQGVNDLQPGKEAVARLLQKEALQQELTALTKRQLRQRAAAMLLAWGTILFDRKS